MRLDTESDPDESARGCDRGSTGGAGKPDLDGAVFEIGTRKDCDRFAPWAVSP